MTIHPAFSAELLKLRRTLALRLALAVPAAVVALNLLIAYQQPDVPTKGNPFVGFAQGSLMMWTLLVLPLFIALVAALVAAIDHQGDNWKHLFALPVSRLSVFMAKWMATATLVLVGSMTVVLLVWPGLALLRVAKPGWREFATPWTLVLWRAIESASAAAFMLSIQLWVSLRWKSFVAGLAVVIVALMVMLGGIGSARSRSTFAKFYPWALPVTAIARMTEPSRDRSVVAAGGLLAGVFVAVAGCWALSRRELVP
jgi:hypothetical protein